MTRRIGFLLLFLGCLLVAGAWATDFVTLQGEWTIYTASCRNGQWSASGCSGSVVASSRYRFRALKAHKEVLFWTAGDSGPSGRFEQCRITDGRNWLCPPGNDIARTITHEMVGGKAIEDPKVTTIPFHAVPKWKWEFLNAVH